MLPTRRKRENKTNSISSMLSLYYRLQWGCSHKIFKFKMCILVKSKVFKQCLFCYCQFHQAKTNIFKVLNLMLKTQSRKGSKKDENTVEKRQQIRTETEWRKGRKRMKRQ